MSVIRSREKIKILNKKQQMDVNNKTNVVTNYKCI